MTLKRAMLIAATAAMLAGCEKKSDPAVTSSSGGSMSTRSFVTVKGGVQ